MWKTKLENGMVAVIEENHSVPVVAIQVWVKVGSGDEADQEAGLSHFFEHMLFKGTQQRGLGEIAKEVETSGGYINAFTSFEETVFHVVIASRFFDTGLDVLADAVQHSAFEPEELEKEKEVILEEIKRGLDAPQRKLNQELFTIAYPGQPFGRPIIGYEETVKGFTRADLIKFYRKWYVPNNMAIVVVGDVEAKKAASKIRGAFRNFRPGKLHRAEVLTEASHKKLRASVMKEEVKESYLDLAFNVPGLMHADSYAAEVLSVILGQGDSSRLVQRIKEERGLVHGIGSVCFVPKGPGLLTFSATLDDGCAIDAVKAILGEVYRFREGCADGAELNKAKINIEGDFIFEKETVQGFARTAGFFEAIAGDAFFEKEYLRRIAEVSAEDIRRFAQQHLMTPKLSIALMLPKSSKLNIDRASLVGACAELEAGLAKRRLARPAKKPNGLLLRREMENGIRLIVKENHLAPIVAIKVAMLGGLKCEDKSNNGINNFVAQMLTKGTASRSALDIATRIESMAGAIDGFSGRNSLGLSAEIMSRYFEQGLEITSDVILNPAFDPGEMEKKRVEIFAAIKEQSDDPFHSAFSLALRALYRVNPYGMEVLGTERAVKRFKAADLKSYYQKYCAPKNMVMVVVGDLRAEEVVAHVEKYFGSFEKVACRFPAPPQEPPIKEARIVKAYKDKQQAHVVLAFHGVSLRNPDRYPIQVMNSILSGQAGRLFIELRDKGGLAYSVSSFSWEGIDPGYIAVYAGISPEKIGLAVDCLKKELKKIRDEKADSAELARAKKFIIGNFEINLQRNIAQASNLAFNELYGLGYDHYKDYPREIQKVTAADVLEAANKYLALDRCVLAVLRPKAVPKRPRAAAPLAAIPARRGKRK